MKNVPLFIIFFVGIFIDQGTKVLARYFSLHHLFGINVIYNDAFSFGLGGSHGDWLFTWVLYKLLFVIFCCGSLFWMTQRKQWRDSVAHVIFLSGAVSNMLDRALFMGGVVDWMSVPFFGVYNNFADWMIVLSAIWIVGVQCFSWMKQKHIRIMR